LRFKTLFFSLLLLSGILYADISIKNDKCGYGYDSYEGTIKKTPFFKPKCTTLVQNSNHKLKLIRITDLQYLFKHLGITKNRQFFNNHFVKKIFDNPHINSYTLTYMIYQDITVFKKVLQNDKIEFDLHNPGFLSEFGDSYIKEVKSGGEHILFFHILTDSLLEYEKSKKTMKRSLRNIEEFKRAIEKVSKNQQVVVKELFTKSLDFIPQNELSNSFTSLKNFEKMIKKNSIPYKYSTQPYLDLNTTLIEEKKRDLQKKIDDILLIKSELNDYNYYRHNPELFLPIDTNNSRYIRKIYEKNKELLKHVRQNPTIFTELNTTLPKKELPIRYKASRLDQTINLNPQYITLNTKESVTKIKPDKKIKIYLLSKLDIQNKGQLLRIKNTIICETDGKRYKKTDTGILFDTYVNFSGLRFESILNDYGTTMLSLPFNKYEQFIDTEGVGIIDKANCGYEISEKNELKISCKNIIYKPIRLKFVHEEDF